jgi:hypothetical protein
MKLIVALLALFITTAFAIFMGVTHYHSTKAMAPTDNSPIIRQSVIVELFTSEGCSSCPPADALLKELSEQQPVAGAEIIALEEHVDYWDHLGWKDPYSSFSFTERQGDYSKLFNGDGVYTPQMVVDGHSEFVGSRSREARKTIEQAATQPKLTIQLLPALGAATDSAAFEVKISNLSAVTNGHEAELWISLTEKGLHTDVKAGENSGEHLQHAAIVRVLRKANSFSGTTDYQTKASLKLNAAWQRENLCFVAFAVEKDSRKIIGAASAKL